GRIVEDNNLHAQIKALRKAFLGHDFIRTVVGRGYQFKGGVRALVTDHSEGARPEKAPSVFDATPALTNLPAPTSDLIGRDGEIAEVAGLVADPRFVPLTGTGGIGKTRLAVEVVQTRHQLTDFGPCDYVAGIDQKPARAAACGPADQLCTQ